MSYQPNETENFRYTIRHPILIGKVGLYLFFIIYLTSEGINVIYFIPELYLIYFFLVYFTL